MLDDVIICPMSVFQYNFYIVGYTVYIASIEMLWKALHNITIELQMSEEGWKLGDIVKYNY